MNFRATTLILGVAALAGCSSGSAGRFTNTTFVPIYASVERDGVKTNFSELDSGLVFVLSNVADGTVSEFFVRSNADKTVLYVSKDGGPEVEYATEEDSGAITGENADGDFVLLQIGDNDGASVMYLANQDDDTLFNLGAGGLETEISDLPSSSATYEGAFVTFDPDFGVVATTSTTDMTVNFANGGISGTHSGTFEQGMGGDIEGDIYGSTSGSRLSGSLSVTGAATGTLDFGGMAQGEGASSISGGIAGTLTDGDDIDYSSGGAWAVTAVP